MSKESRIRILPESLANQIAAGEVVQRPASLLKELVENSIDAGAGRVEIDLESGGAARVQVVDDGHGMSEDDALLCLERHATSKIATDWDLGRVAHPGLPGRGAAEHRRGLEDDHHDQKAGGSPGNRGARGGRQAPARHRDGSARPARESTCALCSITCRRGANSSKEERPNSPAALEAANQAAMANPNVSFILRHGRRTLLDLDASGGVLTRAAQLVGEAAASHLLKIPRASSESMTFSGWAGAPGLNRSTRGAQYLFVNGRPIRDRLFVHAAYAAYRSFMPVKRHPVFILFLDMPPEDVDVNVHPAKQEVRFRFASSVYDLVRESVAAVLGARPERMQRDFAHQGVSREGSVVAAEGSAARTGSFPARPSAPALLGGGGYFGDRFAAGDFGVSVEEGSHEASQPASGAGAG